MGRTLSQTFQQLRRPDRPGEPGAGRIGLIPFIPAGYPDLPTTAALLSACDQAGASTIEVGFPFSDPIADGPIIQEAFTAALAHKIKVADVLAMVQSARASLSAPLLAMLSYSIIFRYGTEKFLSAAKAAGFDGLIVPDLPPPEAEAVCGKIRAAGLDTVLLISPTTSPPRRQEIVKWCSGFVYCLSISGITGERYALPEGLRQMLDEIKGITNLPVCVGFGIHRPQQVAQLAQMADGAIVGSAIVRRIKQHLGQPPAAIAQAVGQYLRELAGGRL
jgi:tryptophan synthase alpha chain